MFFFSFATVPVNGHSAMRKKPSKVNMQYTKPCKKCTNRGENSHPGVIIYPRNKFFSQSSSHGGVHCVCSVHIKRYIVFLTPTPPSGCTLFGFDITPILWQLSGQREWETTVTKYFGGFLESSPNRKRDELGLSWLKF
jgi:hypothetical protein